MATTAEKFLKKNAPKDPSQPNISSMTPKLTHQNNLSTLLVQSGTKRKTNSPAGLSQIDTDAPDINSVAIGINAIISQLAHITETQGLHTGIMSEVSGRVSSNSQAITKLQDENQLFHQAKLNDRIEITGVKEIAFVDKKSFRVLVWQKLREMKIDIEKVEIADAYPRKTLMKDGSPRYAVVVIFTHESIKSRVMNEKMLSKEESAKGIFFNEVLTSFNRHLIYTARQFKKKGNFVKVGTLNGKIFVIKSEGGEKIYVDNVKQMEELANLTISANQSENKS